MSSQIFVYVILIIAGAFFYIFKLRQTIEKQSKNIVDLSYKNKKLKELAFTDSLTGLLTRRAFEYDLRKFNGIFSEGKKDNRSRFSLSSLGVMSIDIDHFKKINDTLGHPVGDIVLKKVAKTISHTIRATDLLCRTGGEEFMVALPGVPEETLDMLAEKVRETIAQIVFDIFDPATGKPWVVTVSIGVTYTEKHFDYSELEKKVDAALYSAKKNGRNRVVKS